MLKIIGDFLEGRREAQAAREAQEQRDIEDIERHTAELKVAAEARLAELDTILKENGRRVREELQWEFIENSLAMVDKAFEDTKEHMRDAFDRVRESLIQYNEMPKQFLGKILDDAVERFEQQIKFLIQMFDKQTELCAKDPHGQPIELVQERIAKYGEALVALAEMHIALAKQFTQK
ncbi:hypothetical protein ACFL2V_15180 [Pseudomonadota bacterium]